MGTTVYCQEHECLELVEKVEKVRRFAVSAQEGPLGVAAPTGRYASEVWATTDADCGAHFIGGRGWRS